MHAKYIATLGLLVSIFVMTAPFSASNTAVTIGSHPTLSVSHTPMSVQSSRARQSTVFPMSAPALSPASVTYGNGLPPLLGDSRSHFRSGPYTLPPTQTLHDASVIRSALATNTITIDGHGGGRIFDGIGAVSAGASSRLLIDYPEPYRSQVLDYLFKPGYGASLQHLKVEIGGDTNSTTGAEPTHMRSPTDQNYTRGYEWWLMEQAKARNPNIVLSALEWGAPGWIGGGNFFSQDNINYIINFIKGAKVYHNLNIQYIGIWNETHYDTTWIKHLKSAVEDAGLSTKVIAGDQVMWWSIADDMNSDPALNTAVGVLGVHYPGYPIWGGIGNFTPTYASSPAAQQLGKPLWATEDGPERGDWIGAMELAKMYNRNYIEGRMTATMTWAAVTSYYHDLSSPGAGLMSANTPWSGAYTVQPAIWAVAHTTQFAQPGWQYIDSASGYLVGQGSYVTLKAPTSADYSMVAETIDATGPQTLTFTTTNGLSQGVVHVWETTQTDSFMRVADLSPVSGTVTITLDPHAIYSLTTTTGQGKGSATGATPTSFPFPYTDNFYGYSAGDHPRYLADQEGSFEIAPCIERDGDCLSQIVEQPSIPWVGGSGEPASSNHNNPTTVVGDVNWRDYTVSTDVLLEQAGPVYLYGHGGGCWLRLDSNGAWTLNTGARNLTGAFPIALNTWHTLTLTFIGTHSQAYIDGFLVASIDDGTYPNGLVGVGTGWINGHWNTAQFDNLSVHAVTQTTPAPVSTSAPSATTIASSTPSATATATVSSTPTATTPTPTSTPTPTTTMLATASSTPASPIIEPLPTSISIAPPSATSVPPPISVTPPFSVNLPSATSTPPPHTPLSSTPAIMPIPSPAPTKTTRSTGSKPPLHRHSAHPHPTLPLTVRISQADVVSNHQFSIQVHTVRFARLMVVLRVTTTKVVVIGRGRHSRRRIHTILVYQMTRRGAANAHGYYSSHLLITYKPAKPMHALLVVKASAAHAIATHNNGMTILPARRPQRRPVHQQRTH